MATIINNPPGSGPNNTSDNSGLSLVVGVLLGIVIIALFFVYALPAIRGRANPANSGGTNINVSLPAPTNNNGANNNPQP